MDCGPSSMQSSRNNLQRKASSGWRRTSLLMNHLTILGTGLVFVGSAAAGSSSISSTDRQADASMVVSDRARKSVNRELKHQTAISNKQSLSQLGLPHRPPFVFVRELV